MKVGSTGSSISRLESLRVRFLGPWTSDQYHGSCLSCRGCPPFVARIRGFQRGDRLEF